MIRKIIWFFWLLFASGNIVGQNLHQSKAGSYVVNIYQLSDAQAEEVYQNNFEEIKDAYFSRLIDSYPQDSVYHKDLPMGHYLHVWSSKNKLKVQLQSVSNVAIKVLKNGRDLMIMLHDQKGREITDAEVYVDNKRLGFDQKSNTFRQSKSNLKGLLKVSFQGITTFTYLDRELNNPRFTRGTRKILHSSPIVYFWLPVKLALRSPVDGFMTIWHGYPRGVFYFPVQVYNDLRYNILRGNLYNTFLERYVCMFDEYHCPEVDYHGYLAFNQPRYRPGDTLKMKAFITYPKGTPFKKEIEVYVSPYSKKRKWMLKPYRPGAYAMEIVLHDSLDLKLDNNYWVYLEHHDNTLISEDFMLEDYELKANEFELRIENGNHMKGEENTLIMQGKDINGLNLYDARAEINLLSFRIDEIFDSTLIVKDTLWSHQMALKNNGETTVPIADSVFCDFNGGYQVVVNFFTTDNERHEKKENVNFYHNYEQIETSLQRDSVLVAVKHNLDTLKKGINWIIYSDQLKVDSGYFVSPGRIKLNEFATHYDFTSGDLTRQLKLSSFDSEVKCLSSRDKDSVRVFIENPRKLKVRYHIYKMNHELTRGYTLGDFHFSTRNQGVKSYFVNLQYIWEGVPVSKNFSINWANENLDIKLIAPKVVYPGEEAEINIVVQDAKGKPVENVDLLAHGLTKKFTRHVTPELPSFSHRQYSRTLINNFNDKGNVLQKKIVDQQLRWQQWQSQLQLDTIEYYRFLYTDSIYHTTVEASNKVTQISPFVVKNGILQPVKIVYLDGSPEYFSFSDHYQPYSFPVTRGFHQVKLRTDKYEIAFRVKLEPDVKNIYCINLDLKQPDVTIKEVGNRITWQEERMINRYSILVNDPDQNEYLKQGSNVFWIKDHKDYYYQKQYQVGPVLPRMATWKNHQKYELDFMVESPYEYNFSDKLIKMKYHYLDYKNKLIQSTEPSLYDFAWDEEHLIDLLEQNKAREQVTYRQEHYPSRTTAGNGRVGVWKQVNYFKENKSVKNILLFRDSDPDFIRVYQGTTETLHDLNPDQYSAYILLLDNHYLQFKHFTVDANATTYLRLDSMYVETPDSTTYKINELIKERMIYKPYHVETPYKNNKFREINRIYLEQNRVNRDNAVEISGVVRGAEDGEPLPGVNVIAKGTEIGTVTGIDGSYTLWVPEEVSVLVFSYIGYTMEEKPIGVQSVMDVVLYADVQQLQEVVVVGYGVVQKQNLTGSIVSVNSSGAPGLMPDMALQGQASGVMIRGVGSIDANKAPLYIVDGVLVSEEEFKKLNSDDLGGIEVLKDAAATAIYGSRAANGVVLITTRQGGQNSNAVQQFIENSFDLMGSQQMNAIRSNFRDYAFWKPRLTTDKNGVAKFKVTFPDDVTAWKTLVLAMNGKKQTGQVETEIKSFKPLMGTLSTPRFLVEGDTTFLIGKGLNYTNDTLAIATEYKIEDRLIYGAEKMISTSVIDSLQLVGKISDRDSVNVTYLVKKADGYFDGESREIPLYRKGSQQTDGYFYTLTGDTAITTTFQPGKTIELQANASLLDEMIEELNWIRNYPYFCNEQAASKLKALLMERNIRQALKQPFENENQIEKLIKTLEAGTNNDKLWGWWPGNETRFWISRHVVEALLKAKRAGFNVKIEFQSAIVDELIYSLENSKSTWYSKLDHLHLLRQLDSTININPYVDSLAGETKHRRLDQQLEVIALKQLTGMPYSLDTLIKHRKKSLYGNSFWQNSDRQVFRNQLLTTLLAYQILQRDSSHQEMLPEIRNYLLEERTGGRWRNTFESARILETILPGLINDRTSYEKVSLKIPGIDTTVSEFPYHQRLNVDGPLTIEKDGSGPLYVSLFDKLWNPDPQPVDSIFMVKTYFEDNTDILQGGKPVVLKLDVWVSREADYVMIEVPVPAGCSYEKKRQYRYPEVHREYLREKVSIFCQHLPVGSYTFEVELLPRYSGSYTLNPAKVEQMYFPVFYGRNGVKRVVVE